MMKGPKIRAVILALCFLWASCSQKIVEKLVTQTVTEYRDSTVFRDSTIFVPIPLEADQAIVHIQDTSHRETSVAESDAWISPDGFLNHTLRNKPGKLAYQITWPERYLVSSVKNTKEQAHVIPKEVKVEKPLNAWQRFRIGAFWWLLGLVLFAYRKQILTAIMNAFGHY